MNSENPFDLLERFAEIERLISKIYFRFSHLFLHQPELRDFWWEMANEEDQHGSILLACKTILENCMEERLDSTISREKAEELKTWLLSYFSRGTPSLGVEEAFRIALEIESSEINTICNKLMQTRQMSSQYSRIARSEEKFPECATFRIETPAQRSGSLYARAASSWQST